MTRRASSFDIQNVADTLLGSIGQGELACESSNDQHAACMGFVPQDEFIAKDSQTFKDTLLMPRASHPLNDHGLLSKRAYPFVALVQQLNKRRQQDLESLAQYLHENELNITQLIHELCALESGQYAVPAVEQRQLNEAKLSLLDVLKQVQDSPEAKRIEAQLQALDLRLRTDGLARKGQASYMVYRFKVDSKVRGQAETEALIAAGFTVGKIQEVRGEDFASFDTRFNGALAGSAPKTLVVMVPGHAMLVVSNPVTGEYRFFDPNDGIYKFQDREQLATFLGDFSAQNYAETGKPVGAPLLSETELATLANAHLEVDLKQGIDERRLSLGTGVCLGLCETVAHFFVEHPDFRGRLNAQQLGLQAYEPARVQRDLADEQEFHRASVLAWRLLAPDISAIANKPQNAELGNWFRNFRALEPVLRHRGNEEEAIRELLEQLQAKIRAEPANQLAQKLHNYMNATFRRDLLLRAAHERYSPKSGAKSNGQLLLEIQGLGQKSKLRRLGEDALQEIGKRSPDLEHQEEIVSELREFLGRHPRNMLAVEVLDRLANNIQLTKAQNAILDDPYEPTQSEEKSPEPFFIAWASLSQSQAS